MNDEWSKVTLPSQHSYAYSKPLIIKKWSNGSIIAQVGYVREHPEKNKIVLTKTWAGKGGVTQEKTYNIDKGDWTGIKENVEKLLPQIGEIPTADGIDYAINKISQDSQLLEIVAKYPTLLSQLPKDADILSLPEDQKEALKKFLATGGSIANKVIDKLAEQPITDLEHFSILLDDLKLSTINALVTHITGRLNFIDMFEKIIHNDNTYERRGEGSVHSHLRANMWLLDRNYSILHDDETIRKIIHAQWDKEMKGDEVNIRPDFLCMTDRQQHKEGYEKLVIIEIKKPSVTITMAHIKQVMGYKRILQKHSGKTPSSFICYVIGRQIEDDLLMNPLTEAGFITKTYTDFIGDSRSFYQDYRKIVKEETYPF